MPRKAEKPRLYPPPQMPRTLAGKARRWRICCLMPSDVWHCEEVEQDEVGNTAERKLAEAILKVIKWANGPERRDTPRDGQQPWRFRFHKGDQTCEMCKAAFGGK